MDAKEAARHSLASVEASVDPCESVIPPRSPLAEGLDLCDEWPRSLVECWRQPHEPCGHDSRTPTAWPCQPPRSITAFGTFKLNRRIRIRTCGGVGGQGSNPPSYPIPLRGLARRSTLWPPRPCLGPDAGSALGPTASPPAPAPPAVPRGAASGGFSGDSLPRRESHFLIPMGLDNGPPFQRVFPPRLPARRSLCRNNLRHPRLGESVLKAVQILQDRPPRRR